MAFNPQALAVGMVLANSEHVKSPQQRLRAGLLLGLGGLSPIGLVLAQTSIRHARKAELASQNPTTPPKIVEPEPPVSVKPGVPGTPATTEAQVSMFKAITEAANAVREAAQDQDRATKEMTAFLLKQSRGEDLVVPPKAAAAGTTAPVASATEPLVATVMPAAPAMADAVPVADPPKPRK